MVYADEDNAETEGKAEETAAVDMAQGVAIAWDGIRKYGQFMTAVER